MQYVTISLSCCSKTHPECFRFMWFWNGCCVYCWKRRLEGLQKEHFSKKNILADSTVFFKKNLTILIESFYSFEVCLIKQYEGLSTIWRQWWFKMMVMFLTWTNPGFSAIASARLSWVKRKKLTDFHHLDPWILS